MSHDSDSDRRSKIKELEELACAVLDLKENSIPRRPIVIEFCGSPKAGKTSCINSLDLFFRRNKFRTRVLTERASICPISSKHDPYFNIWTVSSAIAELAEVLANHSKDYDIVILDRGIFDALCWFNWLLSQERMSEDFEPIEKYLTMRKWLSLIDLIYVFTTTPEESLKREFTNLLTDKPGSIMQPRILKSYKLSIEECVISYEGLFKSIEMFDTTDLGLNEVNYHVTKRTLHKNISERIGFIASDKVPEISEPLFCSSKIDALKLALEYGPRSNVEVNDACLQPLPIVVVTNSERTKVLSVQKKAKSQTQESSPEASKLLLYLGGHIRQEDQIESSTDDVLSVSRYALHREIKEEIGIDFHPNPNSELFCIWDKSTSRSRKHLAICYLLEEDLETLKLRLDKNEFKECLIIEIDKLDNYMANYRKNKKVKLELENWSKLILKNIFTKMDYQGNLLL